MDPEAFCGLPEFMAETSHLASISRQSPAIDKARPVRMPGDQGLARRAAALRDGVVLSPATASSFAALERRFAE